MKRLSILGLLAGTTLLCAFPVSLQLSQDKLSVSLDTASARVGQPLTPVSVAGVARRADRRAYRRGAVATGAAIGAGTYYGAGAYSGVERRADRRAYRRGVVAAGAVAAGAAIGAGTYYGAGPYYAAGSYYGSGVYPGVARRAYYASGGYNSGYDAYASANFGDSDTYILRGVPISEAEAVRYCARTFRSYDSGSRTFLASNGERVSCPQ